MKKKKINFDDLIDRLIICIEKRNPNTILDQTQIDLLKSKWRYKEKQLYSSYIQKYTRVNKKQ